MRLLLSLITIALLLFAADTTNAQTIISEHDTVWTTPVDGSATMYNRIKTSTGTIVVKWKVVSSNFPADWLPYFGYCDNNTCYNNAGNELWPSRTVFTSSPYDTAFETVSLHLELPPTSTPGIFYLRVKLYNQTVLADSNTIQTYFVSGSTLGIESMQAGQDLSIYPNPATSILNIKSDTKISQFSISNQIGQTVYTAEYNSIVAQANIKSLPAGVYFATINNNVVRRFVKQ